MSPSVFFAWASAACGGGLALAGATRANRSIVRWAFVIGMSVLALESVCTAMSFSAVSPLAVSQWQAWKFTASAAVPGVWLLFSVCYARANERGLRSRDFLLIVAAIAVPLAVTLLFRDRIILTVQDLPWSGRPILNLGWPAVVVTVALLIGSIWIVRNLERTFRASVGTMRWRIKFMLLGIGALFVVRIYTSSQILLFHRDFDLQQEVIDSGGLIIAALLVIRSFSRAGHFDIQVYPSQSALQSSFTILLAGVYLLLVGVLAKVVTYLGGDSAFAAKAFVILASLVLLAIALQSDRARLRLRQFVSRHFHRSPYNYRAVWKTFTEGTASRVEQTDLCRGLVRLTADTFQALSVSILLIDDKKEGLLRAASTWTSTSSEAGVDAIDDDAAPIIHHFQSTADPVDIETRDDKWAVVLRKLHPSQFYNGGHRICVPMIARGDLLGLMIVGDRVGGVAFSLEDLDMFKCIADHAASSLLNVQLSKKLVAAKELEAFQSMAAFFVHDLKNAASTLNLMLQNLPVHYADPEFREDALRGIAKSVSHINRLISRLGSLRHELNIEVGEADFNDVVNSVLAGIEHAPGYSLIKEIQPLPRIRLDSDQIHKVVTNLVLNATEALPPHGQVRVATAQENGWVVLTVEDNGCGMSPEFLKHSLFRPFQTTKKNGLGIGMFQSKMIVEAHGGRIAVMSEPGKGTTFKVFLSARHPS